jgi:hypothetical protein
MAYWTTTLGKRKKFDKIGHQHLSNILWFKEVFNKANSCNDRAYRQLWLELHNRYAGKRLLWKPLPIPTEIETLKAMGLSSTARINSQAAKSMSKHCSCCIPTACML